MTSRETKECKIIFLGIKCDNLAIDAGEIRYLFSPLVFLIFEMIFIYKENIPELQCTDTFGAACVCVYINHWPTEDNILTCEFWVVISIPMCPNCEAALHECKSMSLFLGMQ